MRIGYDVSALTRQRTGVGNYTYYLLKHLIEQGTGCDFRLFSSGLAPVDVSDLAQEARGAGRASVAMHRHLRLPTRLLYKCWDAFGGPAVDRLLGGADLYHATNYYLPPTGRARRIVTVYDLAFLKNPEWGSPKIVGPFSRHVRRFAGKADAVITCSEATRRDVVDLLAVPSEKVSVAHGAVDEGFAALSRPEAESFLAEGYGLKPPFVLFVSTLEPRKNVVGLLDAFAEAARDLPHTLVLIGGMGWKVDELEARLERDDVKDRVRHLGYIPSRAHLPAFYSAADAFFLPSFYEGFGLPVLEAMTCGCPVVASDRGSLPEVGGEAVQYVDPVDVPQMAKTLRTVLTDPALRKRRMSTGRARARAFSWNQCADATLAVYRRFA